MVGMGGMGGMGGLAGSTNGTCSGTATACAEQTQQACEVAGCSVIRACSGDAGCEANDTAMACNQDSLNCNWGAACTGTVMDCSEVSDSVTCGEIDGCTWAAN